jgi:hypothetical protein
VFSFRVPNDLASAILKRAGELNYESVSAYCAVTIERDAMGGKSQTDTYAPDAEYSELYTRAQERIDSLVDYRDELQGKMMAMAEVMKEMRDELKRLKKESGSRFIPFAVNVSFQVFPTGDEVYQRDELRASDTDWMTTEEIMDDLTK